MSVWNHIICEGYCMYRSMSKKVQTFYELKKNKRGKSFVDKKNPRKEENKHYLPPGWKPKWCKDKNKKMIPQFKCLCGKDDQRCPFFSMCDADKKDYKAFDKAWDESVTKEMKKEDKKNGGKRSKKSM